MRARDREIEKNKFILKLFETSHALNLLSSFWSFDTLKENIINNQFPIKEIEIFNKLVQKMNIFHLLSNLLLNIFLVQKPRKSFYDWNLIKKSFRKWLNCFQMWRIKVSWKVNYHYSFHDQNLFESEPANLLMRNI